MIDDLEYTLSRPPSCPTNQDYLNSLGHGERPAPLPGTSSAVVFGMRPTSGLPVSMVAVSTGRSSDVPLSRAT